MQSFQSILQQKTAQVNQMLRTYLPAEEGQQVSMFRAMNYSMLAGGKRLRPILMREAYILAGGEDPSMIEPFMAAIEMVHTHSLVHDDLPALDNDLSRRGVPTTHAAFGEAAAILAGDALLNYAYETACRAFALPDSSLLPANGGIWKDPAKRAIFVGKALGILSRKTGSFGMLGGQAVDVENDGKPISDQQLSFIYELKTGALIEASLMIGVCLAGADEKVIRAMEEIGGRIGLAFQIQDDILDVTGDAAELGKPLGSDEKNHKTTYLTHHDLKTAMQTVQQLTHDGVDELELLDCPGDKEFLRELLISLVGRRK